MRVAIDVESIDGTRRTVRVTPLAIIGWERATGRKLSDLGTSIGMEEIARLAWEQERLTDPEGTADTVDKWLATVADLDPITGEAVPTDGAVTAASSSN